MAPLLLLAAAAGSVALCSCATEPLQETATVRASACDVDIRFGSFAAGIDKRAEAAVEALLEDEPGIAAVRRSSRGREGEYALCVSTRSSEDSARLFRRIAESLPGPASAPVTIIGAGGTYSVPTGR
jgi:hypothetical protein